MFILSVVRPRSVSKDTSPRSHLVQPRSPENDTTTKAKKPDRGRFRLSDSSYIIAFSLGILELIPDFIFPASSCVYGLLLHFAILTRNSYIVGVRFRIRNACHGPPFSSPPLARGWAAQCPLWYGCPFKMVNPRYSCSNNTTRANSCGNVTFPNDSIVLA